MGVRESRSPYIALLNSDTVVDKGWLTPLVETVRKDPSVAAACSKLLFLKNSRIVNGVGGGMNYVGYGYDIGAYEVDNGQFDKQTDVLFPHGRSVCTQKDPHSKRWAGLTSGSLCIMRMLIWDGGCV